MRYIIYGAGGIGGGIGVLLQLAGCDVVLIARGAHLQAMQQHGLLVRRPSGEQRVPVSAVGHPSELTFADGDVVIFTMKGQDTSDALDDLERCVGPEIPIVCGQNGVGNERSVARRFLNVYGMLVVMPATFLVPGEIALFGEPRAGLLDSGRYPRGVDATVTQLCADLSSAGFNAQADPDVMRLKYGKLLDNLGNAVGALCGEEALRRSGDDVRAFMRRMRDEAIACYNAARIEYAPRSEVGERRAATFTSGEIAGVERGGSSTWQSFRRGLPAIETDWLNGEIVLLGLEHDVPTPANRALQLMAKRALRDGSSVGSVPIEAIVALEEQLAAG
ncbi:MAG: ketopantoate reductase family protein [Chloroflexota bacterium]|nr:ketopantoate reductase family protein [Chloroflexota bacterium]MDE2894071.1 ketopantoate reductase family protein [Chloroflexota bacterium]